MPDNTVAPLKVWLYTLVILAIVSSVFGMLFLVMDDPWALLR
jgi:hypothetical protein